MIRAVLDALSDQWWYWFGGGRETVEAQLASERFNPRPPPRYSLAVDPANPEGLGILFATDYTGRTRQISPRPTVPSTSFADIKRRIAAAAHEGHTSTKGPSMPNVSTIEARNTQRAAYYGKTAFSPNARAPWGDEEEAAIMAADRPTDSALAAELGRSVASIQQKRRRLGGSPNPHAVKSTAAE